MHENKQLQADRHALIHVMPSANIKLFQIMYVINNLFFFKGVEKPNQNLAH